MWEISVFRALEIVSTVKMKLSGWKGDTMLAYTYVERGKFELQEKPKPMLQNAKDAIVKVTLASICTSDLHIKYGSVPRAVPGVTVGHEMVGIVAVSYTHLDVYKRQIVLLAKSERASKRLLETSMKYLEGTLKLKVNREKSRTVSVFAIRNFKYLGFCLGKNGKGIYIRVHARSWKKAKDKLRMLTSRSKCRCV